MRFSRLVGWTAGVGVILAAAAMGRAGSFRRYTSPPLADGSRYTFLYPADLQPRPAGPDQVYFSQNKPASLPGLFYWWTTKGCGDPERDAAESIRVSVEAYEPSDLPGRSECCWTDEGPECQWGRYGQGRSRIVTYNDRAAGRRVVLDHWWARVERDGWGGRDETVARSFQVIPPSQ